MRKATCVEVVKKHVFPIRERHQRLLELLDECREVESVDATKSLHALSITTGPNPSQPLFLYNNLISMYSSLGSLSHARTLFDQMPHTNIVSYNTILGAYTRNGNVHQAWNLFLEMRNIGFHPTHFTFATLLSCHSLDLTGGYYLYALIIKTGLLYTHAFAGTSLLGLFGRHGCLHEAIRTFQAMPVKNSVTWNSVISLCAQSGFTQECMFLFRDFTRAHLPFTQVSFLAVLSGQPHLEFGQQIHGLVIKSGLIHVVSLRNSFMNMYAKCALPHVAHKIFDDLLSVRDIVSWNTIIGAYAASDTPGRALQLFSEMCVHGILPNNTTFLTTINCCTRLQIPVYGQVIHAKVIRHSFETDVFVGSTLIDFYAKCHTLEDARRCFDEIIDKNLISWNTLILSYSNRGCAKAVSLLREMIRLGHRPNEFSFSSVTKSTSVLELQQLHSLIIRMGYHLNDYVSSSLITSYAKHGLISDALIFVAAANLPLPVVPSNVVAGIYNRSGQYHKTQELFSLLEEPDIVSWNILIAACSRNGDYKEVFELFEHMRTARVDPDNYTYVSLLCVSTKLCNLALGSSLHGLIVKTDFNCCDTFVCNVMIDMYGKCGSLESSVKIFNETRDKNLISWTSLVSALGLHGCAHEALERFREMEMVEFKADGVAVLAVLSACRHVGLVKEGMELFRQMKWKYGVEPEMDHYILAVDLLARYGNLKEAERLIAGMPFPPNALIWRSFLEGCKRQRTVEDLARSMQTCKQRVSSHK